MIKLCDVFSIIGFVICSCLCDAAGCIEAGFAGFDLVCSGGELNGGEFEQKTDRFWEYDEQLSRWVELKLPFHLLSCHNENCTKVGTLQQIVKNKEDEEEQAQQKEQENRPHGVVDDAVGILPTKTNVGEKMNRVAGSLPWWKRVSLTKMSETSIWVTGASGSIYERYWNGLQWVVAPYNLPASMGRAVSVFSINQTILALSEAGSLYQLQLGENFEPVWVEFLPLASESSSGETNAEPKTKIKSGVNSNDGERLYFCTTKGSLLELTEMHPQRWVNHGRPSGADVAAIANPAAIRPETVFTISSSGDLYEYVTSSKPSWKKHIWAQRSIQDIPLQPMTGCSIHGLRGTHSMSMFLLTRDGNLVERLLLQRKWKWLDHGSPKDHLLKTIMPFPRASANGELYSIFCTSTAGHVLEYRIRKQSSTNQEKKAEETWVSHTHPKHAKPVNGALGLQLQVGRMLFPLDDGRIAELHLRGLGGETSGPYSQVPAKKKLSHEYLWSILETPETEGWNAEYCSEERGPSNCLTGTKDESGITWTRDRRKNVNSDQQTYLPPKALDSRTLKSLENYAMPTNWVGTNFRLRMVHSGRSFFLITESGFIFEYLYMENIWLFVKHDHMTPIRGTLANSNMSLFFVDAHGSLILRERNGNDLTWTNCTNIRKGKRVKGGPPWDRVVGSSVKVTAADALFFVSTSGRLLQFKVARRQFRWKDCKHPQNIKIACIVDHEILRDNIIFVVGKNGRLYQYNKVTQIWHEHYQSQHLVLSRLPGTAVRVSSVSLTGSLFMISEDGGLVEYNWNAMDGWNWIEHGKPSKSVTLVSSPGPCFEGSQLFMIGSDGKVYLRYLTQNTWKWKCCGYPYRTNDGAAEFETYRDEDPPNIKKDDDIEEENTNCDPKVSPTRPIPFSEDSVIFELQDGRLAEMKHAEESQWTWSRIIGSPTSQCKTSHWTALVS
ncbi:unnamed protein product [Rhodiola kirilowii]